MIITKQKEGLSVTDLLGKSKRKVEYVELVYDLIFVYLLSRNVSLLDTVENGFLPVSNFLTYLVSSLTVLQIWYVSTLYINHYGDGSLREHLMLFFNMYLLYYMAKGIRADWGPVYASYHIAWALILVNMAIQYFLMGKSRDPEETTRRNGYRRALMLIIEAAMVLISIPVYALTGYALSPWALVFAGVFLLFTWDKEHQIVPGFSHLAERVMLYIVFTFGEMIVGITGYFSEGFSLETVYYSLMAFAIVVGLFSSYGHYYNKLIDQDAKTSGTGYMLLHIVIILCLNNITAAMDFMPRAWVRPLPKTMFLTVSILVLYFCLLATQKYSRFRVKDKKRFIIQYVIRAALYFSAAAVCCRWPRVSIALTAAYIYYQLYELHFGPKELEEQ